MCWEISALAEVASPTARKKVKARRIVTVTITMRGYCVWHSLGSRKT